MKYNKIFGSLAAVAVVLFSACSELEDKDYYKQGSEINSDELEVVNESSEAYLASHAEFSSMNELFKSHGIYSQLEAKNQLSTMLVAANDDYVAPEGTAADVETTVKAHVSDAAVSPANLKTKNNNMRLLMWHGKYVDVDLDDAARNEGKIAGHIMFGTSSVKKVVKTNTGYIYVLSSLVNTPKSINDYIASLDDNYSILRDTVQASGSKEFDKTNSKPIGVNSEGNTIYDTVWIYKNTHFLEKDVDLNSESLTATLLVSSNDVIEAAIADAKARLQKWGLWDSWSMERQHDFEYTMRHWVMDASFYNKKYTAPELQNTDPDNMLSSVFSKYWKTSVQEIDPEPIELSNGVAYKVKKLHIPNNVLIWRLKEEFWIYDLCTAEQKADYFQMFNGVFKRTNVGVDPWTPLAGVWPTIEDRALEMGVGDDANGGWEMDYTLCKRNYLWKQGANGDYPSRAWMVKNVKKRADLDLEDNKVSAFLIPPGKYNLFFGSKQNQSQDIKITVLVNGNAVATSDVITLGSTTTFHYDRNPSGYIEGYDSKAENLSTSKKAGNYDTDGGKIMDNVVIPDVKGDGSPVEVKFKIECQNWAGQTAMTFNHWCLRPTADNY